MGQGNNDTSWRQNQKESQQRRAELEALYPDDTKGEIDARLLFEFNNTPIPLIPKDNGDFWNDSDFELVFGEPVLTHTTGRNQTKHYRTPIIGYRNKITGVVYDEKGNIMKVQIYPKKSKAMNLAFDVTPAKYVTGLITEKGVCEASTEGLRKLFK